MLQPPDPLRTPVGGLARNEVGLCLLVRGSACPNLPNRVIGLFAQQALLPDLLSMRRIGEAITIRIEMTGIDARRAEILAEKMRSIVTVRSVRLRHLPAGSR